MEAGGVAIGGQAIGGFVGLGAQQIEAAAIGLIERHLTIAIEVAPVVALERAKANIVDIIAGIAVATIVAGGFALGGVVAFGMADRPRSQGLTMGKKGHGGGLRGGGLRGGRLSGSRLSGGRLGGTSSSER